MSTKYGDVLSAKYGTVNRVRRRTVRQVRRHTLSRLRRRDQSTAPYFRYGAMTAVRRRAIRHVLRRTLVSRGHGAVLGRVESDVDRRPPDSLPRHRQTTSHARRLVRATSVHHALDICDNRASWEEERHFPHNLEPRNASAHALHRLACSAATLLYSHSTKLLHIESG